MEKIINSLMKTISSNTNYSNIELKKIEYGLWAILDEFTKIIMYFIVFGLLSLNDYLLVILLFFCPIRAVSGGFHNKTYWGCFFFTLGLFLLTIWTSTNISLDNVLRVILLALSFAIIAILSPVDNINKPIKSIEVRKKMKKLSILTVSVLIVICLFIPENYLNTAVLSIVNTSLLLILGEIQKRVDYKKAQKL